MDFKSYERVDKDELLQMMKNFCAIDNYAFDIEVRERVIEEFTSKESLGRIYVIKNEAEPIGYIILTFGFSFGYHGRDAMIDEFYLKAAFRNKGIGKKTMDFIDRVSKDLGVNAVHLEVENHNINAKHLYLSKGYQSKNRSFLTKRMKRNDDD